jgi:hypothetical protein
VIFSALLTARKKVTRVVRSEMSKEQMMKRWNEREAFFRTQKKWVLAGKISQFTLGFFMLCKAIIIHLTDAPRGVEDFLDDPAVEFACVGGLVWLIMSWLTSSVWFRIFSSAITLGLLTGLLWPSLSRFWHW